MVKLMVLRRRIVCRVGVKLVSGINRDIDMNLTTWQNVGGCRWWVRWDIGLGLAWVMDDRGGSDQCNRVG